MSTYMCFNCPFETDDIQEAMKHDSPEHPLRTSLRGALDPKPTMADLDAVAKQYFTPLRGLLAPPRVSHHADGGDGCKSSRDGGI